MLCARLACCLEMEIAFEMRLRLKYRDVFALMLMVDNAVVLPVSVSILRC